MLEKKQHSITYGAQEIEFKLELSQRKTIQITVEPDSSVCVKAPNNKEFEEIINRIKNKASWILKQKRYFLNYKPDICERKYISGESHRYLGKQYRLKFITSEENTIKLQNGYFKIFSLNKVDAEFNKNLLNNWYFEHAKVKFQQRLDYCYLKIRKYGIENSPKIQLRKMNKRWGSCTSDGRIILNLDLIKAPTHCIDYVITHELCHLKYKNHNKDFFNLLSQLMPDWEVRKLKLEKTVFS